MKLNITAERQEELENIGYYVIQHNELFNGINLELNYFHQTSTEHDAWIHINDHDF